MIAITEKEFEQLAEFIDENFGIYLKNEKQSLLMGRLQNELYTNNFDSFTEYNNYVLNDTTGIAVSSLIDKITTNHTYFLREKEHFDFFANNVLPSFEEKELRIWSAGCSTGEEAYTLAMIITDYINRKDASEEIKILATDISNKVLKIAKVGAYPDESASTLPALWKLNYLNKTDKGTLQFNDEIKSKILFKRLNLIDKFSFKRKFHTIFCRNVMIYFNKKNRINLIEKLYEVTEPGGYLFIGQSECISRNETNFKYIMPSVYRKI